MLWNKEKWKWEDLEEVDMQIDEIPGYLVIPNKENNNYYDLIHSSILIWKKERKTYSEAEIAACMSISYW